MSNSVNETAQQEKRVRPHAEQHTVKRKRTVALGAAILIIIVALIITAAVFAVKSSVGFVQSYFGPDENADYFEKYLTPVVMFDPDDFSDLTDVKPSWMLETAIWAAINENETSGTYTTTSDGKEILPEKDVTTYFEKYFGTASRPKYQTFTNGNFTYEYDSKEKCFYIPLVAVTDYEIPKVTKIDKGFNTVTLTVGYISSNNWGQDSQGNVTTPEPEKTVSIVLNGSKGNFAVKSIIDATAENTSSKNSESESGEADSQLSESSSSESSATTKESSSTSSK